MTMRPAPIDSSRERTYSMNIVCSLDCLGCMTDGNSWHWRRMFLFSVNYCPECGRPLGFDADGDPVVGYSPAHLERAAELLSQDSRLSFKPRPGPVSHTSGYYELTPVEVLAEALAATEEAADATDPEEVKHASEN